MKKKKEKNKRKNLSSPTAKSTAAEPVRIWTLLDAVATSRALFILCAFLLPLAAISNFPSSSSIREDYDMWFHLSYGREYIQNLTWTLDHSQFSWSPARSDWMYGTWLGSSLLYVIHQFAGVHGLFLVHYMILGASAGAILWLGRVSGLRAGLGLLTGLLVAAIAISAAGRYIKPEMFSILLVTLTAVAYFRFKIAPGAWIIAVLPIIFLFWVNIHGLWFFGMAFLGLVWLADITEHFFRPQQGLARKDMMFLSSAIGVSILALAANPDGIFYPASVALQLIMQEGTESIQNVIAFENRWKFLWFSKENLTRSINAWIMVAMFFVFTIVWLRARKVTDRADISTAAANIAFFLAGMYMARLTLVYPLIWLPSMVFLAWRASPQPVFSRPGPLLLLTFLLLSGFSAATVAFFYADRSWFGAGYQNYIPDREVAFIKDNDIPGPIFNDYLSGGYLMWAMYPEYKVFIDPRHFPYREQVLPDYRGIGTKYPSNARGLATFTNKYPARIAIIQHKNTQLIDFFLNSPDWALAYFDKTAAVLLHRDAAAKVDPKVLASSLGPERYKNVTDPLILGQLFTYYIYYGSHLSAVILDYYEQNVSSLYWQKKNTLAEMNRLQAVRKSMERRN